MVLTGKIHPRASSYRPSTETAGLYNTAGFNDDTRAFASIPARHEVWSRVTCDWLAGMVVTGVVNEEEAGEMTHEFAYGLERDAIRKA